MHTMVFQEWVDLESKKNADGKGGNPYTNITYILDNESSTRTLQVFDQGLDIFMTGLKKQLGIDPKSEDSNAILDEAIGKKVVANHYLKEWTDPKTGEIKPYWNWGFDPDFEANRAKRSTPATTKPLDIDEAQPIPDL